jgi:D-alanyl-D-alanine dipeptidase
VRLKSGAEIGRGQRNGSCRLAGIWTSGNGRHQVRTLIVNFLLPSGRTLCVFLLACLMARIVQGQQAQVYTVPAPSPPLLVEHNLVNVGKIYPPLLQEIRYATACNFTGQVLYPFPTAFVHRNVAAALQRVQEDLRQERLCLKIFDGYRPISVQSKMWALVPDERYVSDPTDSRGKHTRGTAVDVTLVDHLGNELKMPTAYDDFSDKAHRFSRKWTDEERSNSLKLEAMMKKHGFIPFPFEWWHYDYVGWEAYPPLDISFESLGRGEKTTTVRAH